MPKTLIFSLVGATIAISAFSIFDTVFWIPILCFAFGTPILLAIIFKKDVVPFSQKIASILSKLSGFYLFGWFLHFLITNNALSTGFGFLFYGIPMILVAFLITFPLSFFLTKYLTKTYTESSKKLTWILLLIIYGVLPFVIGFLILPLLIIATY